MDPRRAANLKLLVAKLLLPAMAIAAFALLAGCPLPFDYNGKDAGNAHSSDPSTPSMTATVIVTYSVQNGASGAIADGGSFVAANTTTVTLATATLNSVIFYTDDGTALTDLRTAKKINASSGTFTVTRLTTPQSLDIHAVAVGSNMLPSAQVHATVSVSPYPILSVTSSSASFSEDGGTATFTITSSLAPSTDVTVSLQTSGTYTTADVSGLPGPGTVTKTLVHGTTTISVPLTGVHNPVNANHTITLTLLADPGTPTTYTVGLPANASMTIQDDLAHAVTYNGNGSNGGTVPTDSGSYVPGATVTVANPGTMARTGYAFVSWNTLSDGTGTPHGAGTSMTMGTADVVLYAIWTQTYTVTYNGNGSTSGAPPVDNNRYLPGAPVTVLGTGTLVRTGYTFGGWNTGSQTYAIGAAFPMGSTNVTMGPVWNLNQYTLTVTSGGNGTTSPAGAQTVSHGAPTAISAAPNPLYHFVSWTVTTGSGVTFGSTGTATSTSASDGVTLTAGNAAIQANFALNFYVNAATGSDTNAGTTPAAAFKTISKALTVATVSGEIVNVAPGTYSTPNGETFPLYIPAGVSLIGDEGTKGLTTIILGGGTPTVYAPSFISNAVVMGASTVLAGFTVTNNSGMGSFPMGVLVHGSYAANNVIIRNNTIANNPGTGIYVTGGIGGVIAFNVSLGNGTGLAFVSSGGNGMSVYGTVFNDVVELDTLGPDLGGGAAGSPGGNSFLAPSSTYFSCGGTVYAMNNHWNHNPPVVGPVQSGNDVGVTGTTVITTGSF